MKLVDDLELEDASERAATAVASAVRHLPLRAQYHGTMRFLARVRREMDRTESDSAAGESPRPAAEQAEEKKETTDDSSAPRPPTPGTVLDKAYKFLLANPRIPIVDIAQHLYGDTSEPSRSSARSQLDQLRKRGLAHAVAKGAWEAIP